MGGALLLGIYLHSNLLAHQDSIPIFILARKQVLLCCLRLVGFCFSFIDVTPTDDSVLSFSDVG